MHWLYFDSQSHTHLEQAGYTYDSTFGYNQTVGYRAGTLQSYKPPGVQRILELPLHVMDTALFYPSHLHSTRKEAREIVWLMLDQAERHGGVLTVNWHDRSIAPERQWGDFYIELLAELKKRKTWFPTASGAVSWFQKRRAVVFSRIPNSEEILATPGKLDSSTPELRLRIHQPPTGQRTQCSRVESSSNYLDTPLSESTNFGLRSSEGVLMNTQEAASFTA
jgi:hypothetical protein